MANKAVKISRIQSACSIHFIVNKFTLSIAGYSPSWITNLIVLSCGGSQAMQEKGSSGVIPKPFDMEALAAAVSRKLKSGHRDEPEDEQAEQPAG